MKRLSLSIVLGVVLAGLGTIAAASRSTSGTYTLPGSSFVSGTTISSAAVNDKFNDLATAMTGSLSRDGYGGMKAGAQLQLDDGSASAPGLTFGVDKTAGLYRIGANDYGFAVGGVKTHEWTSTGETVTGTLAVSGAVTISGGVGVSSDFSVATSKFTVAAASGNTSVAGTLGVTGTSNLAGAVTLGAAPLGAYVVQNGTGVDQTGTANQLKLGWDGSKIRATVDAADQGTVGVTGGLGGAYIVSGRIAGGTNCTLTQIGSVTASCARSTTGVYDVSVPGLTSDAIVLVSAFSSSATKPTASVSLISSGSFRAWGMDNFVSSDAIDVVFTVLKL